MYTTLGDIEFSQSVNGYGLSGTTNINVYSGITV